MRKALFVLSFILFAVSLFPGIGPAQVYRYKDADGNWHFTDTPPDTKQKGVEKVPGMAEQPSGVNDLEKRLAEKYRPGSAAAKASLSTVTVKSAVAQGSGFFVSSDGHVITNKHVVRLNKKRLNQEKSRMKRTDDQFEQIEKDFELEEGRLKYRKQQLDIYDENIKKMKASSRKEMEAERYRLEMDRYRSWKSDYEKRKGQFREMKRDHDDRKSDFNFQARQARSARNFTLILKDGTELDAYLVAASSNYDLALLKLDRYRTPRLKPGRSRQVQQGEKVFALGSPLGLRDSVSAGIMSGFSQGHIKTDARIFPGNSGGPLITENGDVIGINTLLKVASGLDGIGMAIPIEAAVEEFGYAFEEEEQGD